MAVPLILVAGLAAAAVVGLFRDDAPSGPPSRPASAPPSRVGQPWEYDRATDKHWNPDHGHWHDGPPPPQQGAPWEYDAVNDRHWNPDHGHWHDGPPPTR